MPRYPKVLFEGIPRGGRADRMTFYGPQVVGDRANPTNYGNRKYAKMSTVEPSSKRATA